MTWKKTAPALVLIGIASIVLAGCAGDDANTTPETEGDGYKLAFVQGVTGDEFYVSMQCGIQEEAAKLGATVTTSGPDKFDPTLQKPIVDSIAASHPDAILVAPTDSTAMRAPLQAAADAGIKVVIVDTALDDPSFAVSSIASDNEGGGAAAFQAIKDAHPEGGKVLVVAVDPGVSASDARSAGFQKAAAADKDFEFLGIQYSHNEPATAAQIVSAALQKTPTSSAYSASTASRPRAPSPVFTRPERRGN